MNLNGTNPVLKHRFTRSDVIKAEHDFSQMLIKTFGEVWRPSIEARYKGVSMDLYDPKHMDTGLWTLVQQVKHKGGRRAAGKIEMKQGGYVLRFIIFYDPADLTDKFE